MKQSSSPAGIVDVLDQAVITHNATPQYWNTPNCKYFAKRHHGILIGVIVGAFTLFVTAVLAMQVSSTYVKIAYVLTCAGGPIHETVLGHSRS